MEDLGKITLSDTIREWQRGQELAVHGWIYGLTDGLLHDLNTTVTGLQEMSAAYHAALAKLSDRADTLERDFDLLVANRVANSNKGVSELVVQLRISLIVTIIILVFTVAVRVVLYMAGHPRRKKKTS